MRYYNDLRDDFMVGLVLLLSLSSVKIGKIEHSMLYSPIKYIALIKNIMQYLNVHVYSHFSKNH